MVWILLGLNLLWGAETDQYWGRWIELENAHQQINQEINFRIDWALSTFNPDEGDHKSLAHELAWALDGYIVYDRFFKWVEENPSVPKVETRGKGVWSTLSKWISVIQHAPHEASTVKMGGVRLGTDKFSHFFTHGYYCYLDYLQGGEEACVEYSHHTESIWYGRVTTGVFSNADMVANFEGHLFYRNLLKKVGTLEPLLQWTDNGVLRMREFDIRDHVNPFWDEALNTSQFRPSVGEHFLSAILDLCPEYERNPNLYEISEAEDQFLRQKYSHLELLSNKAYRMSQVCSNKSSLAKI